MSIGALAAGNKLVGSLTAALDDGHLVQLAQAPGAGQLIRELLAASDGVLLKTVRGKLSSLQLAAGVASTQAPQPKKRARTSEPNEVQPDISNSSSTARLGSQPNSKATSRSKPTSSDALGPPLSLPPTRSTPKQSSESLLSNMGRIPRKPKPPLSRTEHSRSPSTPSKSSKSASSLSASESPSPSPVPSRDLSPTVLQSSAAYGQARAPFTPPPPSYAPAVRSAAPASNAGFEFPFEERVFLPVSAEGPTSNAASILIGPRGDNQRAFTAEIGAMMHILGQHKRLTESEKRAGLLPLHCLVRAPTLAILEKGVARVQEVVAGAQWRSPDDIAYRGRLQQQKMSTSSNNHQPRYRENLGPGLPPPSSAAHGFSSSPNSYSPYSRPTQPQPSYGRPNSSNHPLPMRPTSSGALTRSGQKAILKTRPQVEAPLRRNDGPGRWEWRAGSSDRGEYPWRVPQVLEGTWTWGQGIGGQQVRRG